jgi:miniconductance mechanosensitive channel
MQPVVTTVNQQVNGWFGFLQHQFNLSDFAAMLVLITLIVTIGLLLAFVVRPLIFRAVERAAINEQSPWMAAAHQNKVFHRVAWIIPGIFALIAAPIIDRMALPLGDKISHFLTIAAEIYLVGAFVAIVFSLLDTSATRFLTFSLSRKYTIKSYIQVLKLLILALGLILIVSIILGRSPFYLLTGLGALTAVGVVAFREPLMGFMTSIHLSANDIIRVGDWVEIPKFGVDGMVIDISLTTVKIQNFDKSVITIPSNSITIDGIKNWRLMLQSGCRRIKRHITINAAGVKFCNSDDIDRLRKLPLLNTRLEKYLADEQRFIDVEACKLLQSDARGLTNLTLYRLYLEAYLSAHPRVATALTYRVRELQNENYGIPLELNLFLNINEADLYEAVQADIFDFAYSVLPLFELEAYQYQAER